MAKILLIDDSKAMHKLVYNFLTKHHMIACVDDWPAALSYLHKALDLILLDINMPGFNGDQVANLISQNVQGKTFKIIFFSTEKEEKLQALANKTGVDGYIHKQDLRLPELFRSKVMKFLE